MCLLIIYNVYLSVKAERLSLNVDNANSVFFYPEHSSLSAKNILIDNYKINEDERTKF